MTSTASKPAGLAYARAMSGPAPAPAALSGGFWACVWACVWASLRVGLDSTTVAGAGLHSRWAAPGRGQGAAFAGAGRVRGLTAEHADDALEAALARLAATSVDVHRIVARASRGTAPVTRSRSVAATVVAAEEVRSWTTHRSQPP